MALQHQHRLVMITITAYGYIITWILHQIFVLPHKVKQAAAKLGSSQKTPISKNAYLKKTPISKKRVKLL